MHGSIAKGLGILLHFSQPGRIAAHQEQLCILVLKQHIYADSLLRSPHAEVIDSHPNLSVSEFQED